MTDADEDVVLELRDLHVGYYKDLNILQSLNIKARKGQITAILGANGVGKSTALKAVFGFLRPNGGQVLLEGEDIIDVPTHQRILKGLAYIPQQPGIFKDMSVEENLELGGWTFKRDKKQIAQKNGGKLRALSCVEGKAQADHRRTLWRSTADGGDKPHPDGRTAHATG
jgi:ABC-type branched-subunit amino acid transport system ATPase component